MAHLSAIRLKTVQVDFHGNEVKPMAPGRKSNNNNEKYTGFVLCGLKHAKATDWSFKDQNRWQSLRMSS